MSSRAKTSATAAVCVALIAGLAACGSGGTNSTNTAGAPEFTVPTGAVAPAATHATTTSTSTTTTTTSSSSSSAGSSSAGTSGETIALTVPTWAPILSYQLTPTSYAYRQSRSTACGVAVKAPTQSAQLVVGETTYYGCFYPGTRVEYGATELINPVAPTTSTSKTTTTKK